MKGIFAILLSGVLAGCSSAPAPQTVAAGERTDRLVIGQGREFNSLLPFGNNGFTSSELIGLSFSLLVTLDATGYVPDAAASVPTTANGGVSRDGRTITYHLRHGVRWQDGEPLTSRDVLFTQRVAMDPNSPMPYRDGYDRVAALSAPDRYTVVVHLKQPYRLFVTNFLGPESPTPILPEHLLARERDIVHSAYAARPVGSGPYRIGVWSRGDSLSFEANADWYGGRPAIARIDVHFIPDPTTRLTQLRTGEIDAEMAVAAQTAVQMRGVRGIRVDAESGPIFSQLSFNLKEPIVAERAVRLAVAQTIDTGTIARKVSHGLLDGRDGARGLYLWAYDPRAGYPAYDPAAARRGLEAGGWLRGADGIRRDRSGRRLAFTILLRADRADDGAAAVQIQQQLRTAGIDVALKTLSAPQFTANDSVIRTGNFTAQLTQYYPNIEPDPTIFFACADRGLNGFNTSGYCDGAADAAMYASLTSSDPAEVRRMLASVQRRINATLPMIFLWQGYDVNVVPARLKHFSDLLGLPYSNAGKWSL